MGTDRNIPGIPQMSPQKSKKKSTPQCTLEEDPQRKTRLQHPVKRDVVNASMKRFVLCVQKNVRRNRKNNAYQRKEEHKHFFKPHYTY